MTKKNINHKSKENLTDIIIKNNLCLSNNPYGIDLNWPKSYARLFYNKELSNLYKNKKSPNILEINQRSPIKNNLWDIYFNNPYINNIEFNKGDNLFLFKKRLKKFKYDLVIVNYDNYKSITNSFINILLEALEKNGKIIIENIYFDSKLIFNLFFSFNCIINDYRLKRFLLNNTLVIINKSYKSKQNHLHKFINLLCFLIIDFTLLLIKKSIKKFKN